MPTTYIWRDTASDLSAGGLFNHSLLTTTAAGATVTPGNISAGTSQFGYLFTASGVPGATGTSTGTFTVEVNVTSGVTAIQLAVQLYRVSSTGTVLATGALSAEQQATAGVKTFTFNSPALGTWAAGDRLRVGIRLRSTDAHGNTTAPTFTVNTTNTEIVAPWTSVTQVQKTHAADAEIVAPPTAAVEQHNYRIYADGSESGSTPLATINQGAVVPYDTPFQARFVMQVTGESTVLLPKVQYRHIDKGTGGAVVWSAWADVTTASDRVVVAPSASLTDNEATTQRVGSGTFVAGKVDDGDGTFDSGIALDPGEETELVFSLQLVSADAATAQENFQFRLVNASDSALYDTYRDPTSSVNPPLFWEHGFEGGTNGAAINTTLADPDSFDAILDADSQMTYSTAQAAHGTVSGRVNRTDGAATTRFRWWDLNQGGANWTRFYLYPDALSSTGAVRIGAWTGGYDEGDIQGVALEIDATHHLRVQDSIGVVGTMTAALSADTWYRIELGVVPESITGGVDGSIEVRLYAGDNTTPIETLGPVTAAVQTEVEDLDIGPFQGTLDFYFDRIAFSNEGWIGPVGAAAQETRTHTADAVLLVEETLSHTTDAVIQASTQLALPDSDVSAAWDDPNGVVTTPNLYTLVDEGVSTPDDDTNRLRSPVGPVNAVVEFGLQNLIDPGVHSGHIVRGRFRTASISGTPNIDITLSLYQGAVLIASGVFNYPGTTTAWSTQTVTLSLAEAAAITDYSDLRIRVSANQVSGTSGRVQVTAVDLTVPAATGAAQRLFTTDALITPSDGVVTISGTDFFRDGTILNPGAAAEGLLMNIRTVQATVDFSGESETSNWDPEANTAAFIAQVPTWAGYGVNAVTFNLQGGNFGNAPAPNLLPWGNNYDAGAWNSDGSLKADHAVRIKSVLNAMVDNGIIPIVGLFYFRQDQILANEAAVVAAVDNAIEFLAPWRRQIIVEVSNEATNGNWTHLILQEDRTHELVDDLVTAGFIACSSWTGGFVPTTVQQGTGQLIMLHANGLTIAETDTMIQSARSTFPSLPIAINEDGDASRSSQDHIDRSQNAVAEGSGWGYHDGNEFQYWDGTNQATMDWDIDTAQMLAAFTSIDALTTAGLIHTTDAQIGTTSGKALLVVSDSASPTAADIIWRDLIQETSAVVLISAVNAVPGDIATYDLVVVQESVSSGDVGSKYDSTAVGALVVEQALAEEFRIYAGTDNANIADSVTINAPSHPLAALRTGTVAILSSAQQINTKTGTLPAGVVGVWHPANAGSSTDYNLLAADTGATLTTGTAPARRVWWGHPAGNSVTAVNAEGLTLMRQMLWWTSGGAISTDQRAGLTRTYTADAVVAFRVNQPTVTRTSPTNVRIEWEDAGPADAVQIYRDGVLIAQVAESPYDDTVASGTLHTYKVRPLRWQSGFLVDLVVEATV